MLRVKEGLRRAAPAVLAGVALAAAAPGYAAVPTVRHVAVTDGLAGIQGGGSAHLAALPGQLQNAISHRLHGRLSPQGVDIRVRISQNNLTPGAKAGFKGPALVGTVFVEDPAQTGDSHVTGVPSVTRAYKLTVTPKDAARYIAAKGEEMRTAPERRQIREAMVKSFANYVVAHL
jgi:hypothetical protein